MPEPSVNLVNAFKTFFSNRTFRATNSKQQDVRPKTWVEKEYEAKEAKEKADNALLEKRKRVNSRWNDVKSIFGFGEKLTRAEAEKLVELDARKHFTQDKTLDDFSDKSIWEVQ